MLVSFLLPFVWLAASPQAESVSKQVVQILDILGHTTQCSYLPSLACPRVASQSDFEILSLVW